MSRVLLVLALVLALFVVTNPSRAEFNSWAQIWVVKKLEEEAVKQGQDPRDGSSQVGGALAGLLIPALPIERRNFLAFSIYSLKLPDGNGREKTCSVLGVAGQFVPLGEC
jgi:hypothetical protein